MNIGQMQDELARARRQLSLAEDAIGDLTTTPDWIAAARCLGNVTSILPDIASQVAENALRGGATQAKVARALNLPPSALRGWKATL